MTDAVMTIDGMAASGDETFGVINPATGEVFAEAPSCSRAQLDQAMESCAKAYPAWRADRSARVAALHAASDAVIAAAHELAPLLTAEQGKPLSEATMEMMGTGMFLRHFADLELPREVLQDDEFAFVEVVRRPLGVVAAITPWNFPVGLAARKIVSALAMGNTMILKPSPFTPLSTLKVGEVLNQFLPPGVLNVVSGGDEVGSWITEHPVPRKIAFTGSIATGKKIAAAAAPDLKRVTLELGGNDPAIVLDDVDPEAIADKLFWSAFMNNGQICIAVKRVYAHEGIYADVVDALAERARSARVGDGADEETQLGPLNNEPQFNRVRELVDDAVRSGANVVTGGAPIDRAGYFYAPTILTDVSDGTRIVDEEQFGPVLPVIPFRDVDDAIYRANDTHFGLGASVWTSDPDRGAEMAGRMESGTAWVNTHGSMTLSQPFGGHKWSGIGVENGTFGLLSFTDIQAVHINRSLDVAPKP